MIEVLNKKIFHLQNDKISYLIKVLPNGNLGHVYYGKSLGKISTADVDYMTLNENKSAGTVKYSSELANFTLADEHLEIPVYGTSDFKEGLIEVYEGETPLYLDFQYVSHCVTKGKKRELALPTTFGEEVENLIFLLEDAVNELQLEVTYSIFEGIGAVVRGQKLINLGSTTRKVTRFLSGALDMRNQNFEFLHLSGAWLKERHIKKRPLDQGTVSIGSLKGASGHQHNPFVALVNDDTTNETGDIYGANLIYSGNFLAQTEVDEWDNIRLMSGIHPNYFSWTLAPKASFSTPEWLLAYSDEGYNGLMEQTSRLAERHIIDPKWYQKERPIVLNNWEATYFDFNHEKLIALAKEGKALGMECFVLDDGWFGKRDTDRVSLGDWVADTRKFPNGLKSFANDIHKLGLQLGIWFEPEMVSPDSNLYREHPEWVVRPPKGERLSIGRGQYVLDFANPEVVRTIYQQMKKVIQDTQLDYIKWDMNRNITEAYSNYLAEQKIPQTEFFHRYILGVYRLYELILTDFPNLLIEGCAGGGGRYDLGMLFYSPQIWPSDDSDAVERLAIQSGTLLGYPLSSFSNHISAVPNHQVDRVTSLQMRMDVAKYGPLGYELNLFALSEEEKQQIKEDISFYKEHRHLLTFGQFYQLESFTQQPNEYAWAAYDEKSQTGLVTCYRILAQANPANRDYLKLPFVDSQAVYRIDGELISGSILKEYGLRKPYQFSAVNGGTAQVSGDFQSFRYLLEKVTEPTKTADTVERSAENVEI